MLYLQRSFTMSNPVIADNKPIKVTLVKGTEYYFCACGRSKSQPFCDGSHSVTNILPKSFIAEKDGDAYLCNCKQTCKAPMCDGTHRKFKSDQIGKEGLV